MDRRAALNSLLALGVCASFGALPFAAEAAEAPHKAHSDSEWLRAMLEIAKPDIPAAYANGCKNFLPSFAAVENTIGFPVADQMAIAFLESRIGLNGEKNMFRIESDTFLGKFKSYAETVVEDVALQDNKLADQMKALISKQKKGRGCEREILGLRSSPYLSALFVGCRMDDGRRIVADKVGQEVVEPFMGKGFGWLVHNMGENYLTRFLKEPDAKATKLMPARNVVCRAMPSNVKADALVNRMASLFVGVRDAITQHGYDEILNRPTTTLACVRWDKASVSA